MASSCAYYLFVRDCASYLRDIGLIRLAYTGTDYYCSQRLRIEYAIAEHCCLFHGPKLLRIIVMRSHNYDP